MKALVVIPSYNTGRKLVQTVSEVLEQWSPVWVVIDGSTDGSDVRLERELCGRANLRILRLPVNQGKGAASLHAYREARRAGFTHACSIDADGQHCAADIPRMIAAVAEAPDAAFALGVPEFGPDAPLERVKGRRVGNTFAKIETLFAGPEDSLYGFRVYPIDLLLACMEKSIGGRRYDFDTEAAVRLVWRGVRPINVRTPVRYFSEEEGGVSHFHYVRDNLLLTSMHTRLLFGMLRHVPRLLRQRRRWRGSRGAAGAEPAGTPCESTEAGGAS